ncbi:MAG: hypothetical protein CMJ48_08955 [Planctomycetaceae bacterium]|nr:hypothetical protein [Planctomycetaceae bacterium]
MVVPWSWLWRPLRVETSVAVDAPDLSSARQRGRPFRLCLRVSLQLAGREADAKATAEGLADTVLLEIGEIRHVLFFGLEREFADLNT